MKKTKTATPSSVASAPAVFLMTLLLRIAVTFPSPSPKGVLEEHPFQLEVLLLQASGPKVLPRPGGHWSEPGDGITGCCVGVAAKHPHPYCVVLELSRHVCVNLLANRGVAL